MVNIEDKLIQIKEMVDRGSYFVINRARQYGKTTTLGLLAKYLKETYVVISLDFQLMSSNDFRDEENFAEAFAELLLNAIQESEEAGRAVPAPLLRELENAVDHSDINGLRKLFSYFSKLCKEVPKPIALIIDEVDSATNNQVFLDFLAQLRGYYLKRSTKSIFHSVILAGVYDIKNLKLKLRPESEHKYNSPWNIADVFEVDMSFSAEAIAGMLADYEADHHTGMDAAEIAGEIYAHTSGYPYLVSNICRIMDAESGRQEEGGEKTVWTRRGVAEAVKKVLYERSTLFDSLAKQLDAHRELKEMLREMLFEGRRFSYNSYNEVISWGIMFGYLKEKNGGIVVSNRIFETWIYNLFLSEDEFTMLRQRQEMLPARMW